MSIVNFFSGTKNPKNSSELLGIWERIGDEFEGCLIKVEQEDHELVGKIIWITPEMLSTGWTVGDKKWRRIEGNLHDGWKLMDLRKQFDTGSKKTLSTDYAHYWLTLSGERKLRLHQSRVPLFAAQVWRRVG